MNIQLRYDKRELEVSVAEKNLSSILMPKEYKKILSEESIIKTAIHNPIESDHLENIVKKGETIAIVTSDISRPMPSYKVLPYLVSTLEKSGVQHKDIMVVLALGSHRNHSEDEKKKLVGAQIYDSEVQIIDSDMNNCVNLGTCNNGTPVDVFKPVIDADRVICLGNIEYHYFAGYSGGAKAIMPGVSSHKAIQANHKNMIHKNAMAANLDTNPVRQDIDQVPDFMTIDFIINVVLDTQKNIIGAFAGHWKEAHRQGCKFLDDIYGLKLDHRAEIVLVSPGGYPKDLNLYQAQKGLDNAKHAVTDNGTIILCASAKEGFGEKNFEKWMLEMDAGQRVKSISEKFVLGGHKAAAIGQIQEKADIYIVTDLDKSIVDQIGFVYFETLDDALEQAMKKHDEKFETDAKIIVMPSAGSTLPIVNNRAT